MDKLTGGQLLARTLHDAGVKDVFALHGGHLDAFLVSAKNDYGINLLDTRHEASAGHAAEGYAKVTGKLGVCAITAGPGFTNAFSAIANAFLDRSPVLFIVGSPPLREIEMNSLQGGFDQIACAVPVTKWAHKITHAERVPDLVEKAIRIATSGTPGPVLIDVPIDVMFTPVNTAHFSHSNNFYITDRAAPAQAAIEKAISALQAAERPLIIAGQGANYALCSKILGQFAEQTNIPIVANGKAVGILPGDHSRYFGGVGTAAAAALTGAGSPDTVVLLGARMGLLTGGRSGAIIPDNATLIQVDVDAGEMGRLRSTNIPIVADCGLTVSALSEAAKSLKWTPKTDWLNALSMAQGMPELLFGSAPRENEKGVIHPFHAAKAVVDALGSDAIIVGDGGEAVAWAGFFISPDQPASYLSTGYLGCLGTGQGMSIGASVAFPERRIAVIYGDGAFAFHLQEFDTMVRHRLPIINVVLNNQIWGMSQHGQDIAFGKASRSIVTLQDTDYEKVAEGFGCYGERVRRFDDIEPAIKRAIASQRPSCINIAIDPDVVHPVTISMLGDVGANDAIVVPYYENIPVN